MTPNPAQKKAIESLVGPVLVLAGPGTGKTFTLTERIVHLLKNNVDANRILALTFTENASLEMHERLKAREGLAGRQVPVFTFHSFCQRLIQHYPDVFEVSSEVRPLDEVTKYTIIRKALETLNPKFLRTERGDPYYYVKEIEKKISLIKSEAIRPDTFQKAVKSIHAQAKKTMDNAKTKTAANEAERKLKMAGKLGELWLIYEEYNRQLAQRNLTDYEDMILRVVNAFQEQPDFLNDIRERYDYLHVDEFQDNNSAQNEILYSLAGEEPNLFAVGDEDQSIYRFQGACTENITRFVERYPDSKIISLAENQRSSPPILDFAHALISTSAHRQKGVSKEISKGALVASNPVYKKLKHPVQFILCKDSWNQSEWIAKEILNLRVKDSSLKWSDFAVLFRINKEANDIALSLRHHSIPFQVGDAENALFTPAVQNLLGFLRTISKPTDDVAIYQALSFPPLGVSPSDLQTLTQAARSGKKSLWNILEDDLATLELKNQAGLIAFRSQITTWISLFRQQHLINALLEVLNQSKILEFYLRLAETKIDSSALNAIRSFVDFARDYGVMHPNANLASFLHHVEIAELYKVTLDAKSSHTESEDDKVRLLTIHKAKGLEYRVVFIINTTSGHWEDYRKPPDSIAIPPELILKTKQNENSDEETLEEQRRLLYVAATRAREHLYFVRPAIKNEKPTDESILLTALKGMADKIEWKEIPEADPSSVLQLELSPTKQNEKIEDFLREQIGNLRLSPTALHQYEDCPRQFLYNRIYLIPAPETRPLIYGNAVHEALRRFFNSVKNNKKWPPVESLLNDFSNALKTYALNSADEYDVLEKLAKAELPQFHEWCLQGEMPHVLETESFVKKVSVKNPDGTQIPLSGKLDRIDLQPDGTHRVVDYKTGEPRSENAFFGKTKTSDEKHWDQFRFYKLLDQLSHDKTGKINRGMIIYIQNPSKPHEFNLTAEDAQAIEEKIRKVHAQIQSLDFHPVSENQTDRICSNCAYISLCRANV